MKIMQVKYLILQIETDLLPDLKHQLDYLYQYGFTHILIWTNKPSSSSVYRGIHLEYCYEKDKESTRNFLGENPFYFMQFHDKFQADLWEMESVWNKKNVVLSTTESDLKPSSTKEQTFLYSHLKMLWEKPKNITTVFSKMNIDYRKKDLEIKELLQEVQKGGWTLFLDRDGVINQRIPDNYVKFPSEFEFIKGSDEAIAICNKLFDRVVVVTNQQGIGKKMMRTQMLRGVHEYMCNEIEKKGGKIHNCYHCADLATSNSKYRKPNIGMALQAQKDFPNIDFSKAIMVGDSITDIHFGNRLGMKTVFVETKGKKEVELSQKEDIDYRFSNLFAFASSCLTFLK